jgi:ABC-type uncharacterized transport system permease subunit
MRVGAHKLWNDADAVFLSVFDHVLDVVLGVKVLGRRGHFGVESRIELGLNAEAAHVAGVEVKHVHLVCGHGVHKVLDQVHREKSSP